MGAFERLIACNLHLWQWVVIQLTRLTLLGKVVLLLTVGFLMYVSCEAIGLRKSNGYGPRDTHFAQHPIMNYVNTNGTASPMFEYTQPPKITEMSTTPMSTTKSTAKLHHIKHAGKVDNKHKQPQKESMADNTIPKREGTVAQEQSQHLAEVPTPSKKNVLFIMADDLRAQIGSYFDTDSVTPGDKRKLFTPNIDRLASESLVLKRAYCQYSLCGPSRTSMLTSRSPDTTKVYLNHVYWRESAGPFTTLPEYFKDNGYKTYSIGKVFHIQGHRHHDDPQSWSIKPYKPKQIRHTNNIGANWVAVTEQERLTNPLEDERLVSHAVNVLKKIAKKSQRGQQRFPFFMALGFYRPHVPMVCPEEFFNMYPVESGKQYMSEMSWQTPEYDQYHKMAPFEPGSTSNIHLTHIPDMPLRYLRRSYFACVSYVDHLVGILLRALDDLGLRNSTVVSLVADHGFHLGENDMVSKYTNNELSVRVPLMIRVPGVTDHGVESRSLVELLDVFPTIAAAAGLPVPPPCPERSTETRLCTEGLNVLALASFPDLTLRNAAYSQIFRGVDMMEYSIRTNRMRYTDYATYKTLQQPNNRLRLETDWNIHMTYSHRERKLYDYFRDPAERINLVNYLEYNEGKNHLKAMLREKFKVVHDFAVGVYP